MALPLTGPLTGALTGALTGVVTGVCVLLGTGCRVPTAGRCRPAP